MTCIQNNFISIKEIDENKINNLIDLAFAIKKRENNKMQQKNKNKQKKFTITKSLLDALINNYFNVSSGEADQFYMLHEKELDYLSLNKLYYY